MYCIKEVHLADAFALFQGPRTKCRLVYDRPSTEPTIIWTKNLAGMGQAGFHTDMPVAIAREIRHNHCLNVPVTTSLLNMLVARWNNGAPPPQFSENAYKKEDYSF